MMYVGTHTQTFCAVRCVDSKRGDCTEHSTFVPHADLRPDCAAQSLRRNTNASEHTHTSEMFSPPQRPADCPPCCLGRPTKWCTRRNTRETLKTPNAPPLPVSFRGASVACQATGAASSPSSRPAKENERHAGLVLAKFALANLYVINRPYTSEDSPTALLELLELRQFSRNPHLRHGCPGIGAIPGRCKPGNLRAEGEAVRSGEGQTSKRVCCMFITGGPCKKLCEGSVAPAART